LQKTVSPATANRGDTVTYTISFIAYNYEMSNGTSTAIDHYSVTDTSEAIEINPKTLKVVVQEYPADSTSALTNGQKTSSSLSNAQISNATDYTATGDVPFTLNLSTTTQTAQGSTSAIADYSSTLNLKIDWKDDDGNFRYFSRSLVTISYEAELKTSNAITTGTNTVHAYYYTGTGDDSKQEITPEKSTTVNSYRIRIEKKDDQGNALSGASFGLVKAGTDGSLTKNENATNLRDMYTFIAIYKDKDGNYTTDWKLASKTTSNADGTETTTQPQTKEDAADYTTDIEVDENGQAIIYGLEDTNVEDTSAGSENENQTASAKNDYYLVELKAPDGYNMLQEAQGFSLNTAADYTVATVTNTKGTVLPNTGGMGTKIFYVAGGLMVVGAVIFLITNRRMKSE
jgi:LPXTG-motif cell wall-anchored protein/uncharacterized repeat protein (TIGR01451 family)